MRSECGGRDLPIRHVLRKSKMILGLLEGIPTMYKAENCNESDCPVFAPGNFPKDDEFRFEIALMDFPKAKIANDDLGVIKKVVWNTAEPSIYEHRSQVGHNCREIGLHAGD
ncbi:peptidyl-prolyl cis-trans isomerase PASTICCINO1 [Arabidopsis lyrata subsp. lyrata]|uniref:peptidyl-prolyl cis-trans isomerase PASTICCINO1 n=1 Tax=Arabidopsis lyrata subsp. lyrata TaxID=81972 RepID=UPI000A29A936|nr:peptidyl-prolyl cis-trans isomerase PASTICCINO1 [Arabidopsis lyrata subsp. lyrata]XP_020881217.1 peptidyl-prolyl cis-trans isomerase PASTICCINO1 [Arabidopsis lyrata subsp. lyrata]XP_020881218.1 peptidyl-prolyl cis-trans isomerase PASTICCINO1 [Arabidopsis lyrata subsp. lyrata]XP_020881219.1 peptidyl-prolyl cis-trans isomerase PASTICCINO1 [Arabidopsis lyrata subsp. lyrata]XP_020881220.1 peptidyl-prolyl cis-trans isomerase PASTICCINO1 [Arabidopsis lyrata subsp. lyrata]XP_020881221.1 peptidyl-p|eukprot:XP_020881216.1 peptidyl-prolyl cis-trans isomerase PASTICCINO1 [Arabidopsis lyrata subsp. lyrata]